MVEGLRLGVHTFLLGEEAEEIELDLDNIVPISDDLNTEFADQPSLFAYIAMIAARAEAHWIDSKRYLERIYAETDKSVRGVFYSDNVKVTEGKVKSEVLLRAGYQDAEDYELECREQHLIMKAISASMHMRAQMLISLGANMRAEASQADMLIKETKDKIRRAASRKDKPSF